MKDNTVDMAKNKAYKRDRHICFDDSTQLNVNRQTQGDFGNDLAIKD